MRIVVINPSSGVSGDMLLSALIDLGVNENEIKRLAEQLGMEVKFSSIVKNGICAKEVNIFGGKRYSPEEMKREVLSLKISKNSKRLAIKTMQTLIDAEKAVHSSSPSSHSHFDELSKGDTILDIVGAIIGIQSLGVNKIYSLPIIIGRTPAPCVMEILKAKGIPFQGKNIEHELTTPTGMAILSTICEWISSFPFMRVERIGRGAGKAKFKIPNILQVIIGKEVEENGREEICVLETNIDDITGEVFGYTTEKLLEEGASDVCLIPMIAKKGRPGGILQVLCKRNEVDRFIRIIMEETGTLGVREHICKKHFLQREIKKVKTKFGEVRVKVARLGKKIINTKAEYEDIKGIAKKVGKPFREINKLVVK